VTAHAAAYPPTEADAAFYQDNGYWIAPRIFDDATLDLLRERHVAVIRGEYRTGRAPWSRNIEPDAPVDRLVKIDNSHWSDAAIARHILSPVIGRMAAKLARTRTVRLWHDQLLHKPPDTGAPGNVGWHQDHHYWQCAQPANLLTAWLALDDVTEENGCMQVVPGSHTWGLLDASDFFEQDLDALRARIERATGREFRTVKCEMPAGALSFHHCLTIHGSGPNRSTRPRRSWAIHLMPGGTKYCAGTPADAHMNVALLGGTDGEPFTGPYFPVLWSEGDCHGAWDAN
jgi:ectoine hydroxylase-related dioxygenase (phytanoyl-CoA dioxygenase family)